MRIISLSLLILLWLTGCSSPNFEEMATNRLEYAQKKQGDIEIVVFEDKDNTSYDVNGANTYLNGVLLAQEEINQRSGKLIGRTLKVQIERDGGSFEASKTAIRRVANNPSICAVLGHADPEIAVPASVAYERSQVMFMPPFSTTQGLTGHNFQYVFRMMPSAKIMAEQLASVAHLLGYKKMVILYARDDIDRELAFLFENAAIGMGIKLVQNSSFFSREKNFRNLISQFNSEPIDALFIAASAPVTGMLVEQLREMGVNVPVLGNEVLNIPSYVETAGAAAENTIVPSVYDRFNKKNPQNMNFVAHYKARYGLEPDSDAAQGYDSVMLLAMGIEKAGSTIPTLLSSTLHYMHVWLGATGLHAYDTVGDLHGKKYIFNVWQKGQWHLLPAAHIPYLLQRFSKDMEGQNPNSQDSLLEKLTNPLSLEKHKSALLALAHDMLKFKNLGIIYEDSKNGRSAADYDIVNTVAKQKNFQVVECTIKFSALDRKTIEREMINCFGKLSLNTDALYVSAFEGINERLLTRLTRILPLFRSTSVAIEQGQNKINITLALNKRSDVDVLGLGAMQVYRPLLKGMKVHELAERLHGLPEITVNLQELQSMHVPDKATLMLSPESFIDTWHP